MWGYGGVSRSRVLGSAPQSGASSLHPSQTYSVVGPEVGGWLSVAHVHIMHGLPMHCSRPGAHERGSRVLTSEVGGLVIR